MDEDVKELWERDLLEFSKLGDAYTRLIQSINKDREESKVIAVEAPFGHGKTFFRKEWAKQLNRAGEVVVEIDAQKSDHSGDPVLTFIGALVAKLPETETGKAQAFWEKGKKFGGVVGRTVAKAALKNGAEELIDGLTASAADAIEGVDALKAAVAAMGEGMSKLAGQAIAAQMAAEDVRTKEMPAQLKALREALTADKSSERVVILIDELDRYHPDYAIALLEAMKLVFNQPGFVFVLMVNAEQLEALADRRFARAKEGERYLDKFVDIRLRLPRSDVVIGQAAARILEKTFPTITPFSSHAAFGREAAATLASKLAPASGLSIRQIERVLMKVEIALRCNVGRPLDVPLLIWLAFNQVHDFRDTSCVEFIKRARLSPEVGQTFSDDENHFGESKSYVKFISENGNELVDLPIERYRFPEQIANPYNWFKLATLAKTYLPVHTAVLNALDLKTEDDENWAENG